MNTISEKSTHRIYLWDNLKFILIFFVVLGHFLETYTDISQASRSLFIFIYSFHMPAFIFISGIFSKRNINEKRYQKIFGYLILYIFTQLVLFVVQMQLGLANSYSVLVEDSVPWYAFALFAFNMITIALRNLDPKYLFISTIVLGCFSGYNNSLSDFLVSSRIVVFYPFFLAGYYLDGKKLLDILTKWRIRILSLGIILLWIFFIYSYPDFAYLARPLITGRDHYDTIGSNYGIYRAIYYVATFLLVFCIISLIPNIKNIFSSLGARSVQVYALHRGFIYIFYEAFDGYNFMKQFSDLQIQYVFAIFAFILTIFLSLKIWSKPLQVILTPKWRNETKTWVS